MVPRQPTAGGDALRFKPHDQLNPFGVHIVADPAKSARKTLRVDLPRSCGLPIAFIDIPASIHPPMCNGDALFEITINVANLVCLIAEQTWELVATHCWQHGFRQFARAARDVMGEHPTPPDVLCPDRVPAPKLKDNERAPDALARPQPEMGEFLARSHSQTDAETARELRGPLTWPADHNDPAFSAPLEVEVGGKRCPTDARPVGQSAGFYLGPARWLRAQNRRDQQLCLCDDGA